MVAVLRARSGRKKRNETNFDHACGISPASKPLGFGHGAREPVGRGKGRRRATPGHPTTTPSRKGRPPWRLSRSGSSANQGHQRGSLRRCPGGAGGTRVSPTVSPTLPVARTPQSHHPPPRRRQRLLAPKRESLGEVIVVMESGYTQQKVQPRRRLDARRSGVKGQRKGLASVCAQCAALRAQGNARCG